MLSSGKRNPTRAGRFGLQATEEPQMPDPKPEPHTVPAGILDAFLGNKGPHGELMNRGEPALATDLPDDEDDDDA